MKFLIAVSCLLAVASAGFVGHHSAYTYPHVVYGGAEHLPVIGANGVPVDEPAVQVARAEHAAAHVEAAARSGEFAVVDAHHVAAHVAHPVAYSAGHVYGGYAGPQHLPVIGANGVPVDEPAVQVARAEHVAAHVDAKVRNGDAAVLAHHVAGPVAYAAHHVAAPVHYAAHHVVAHANGAVVPADTVEVAAAKAAHYAAHVEAKTRNGVFHHYSPLVHYRKRRGVFGYGAPVAYAHPVAHVAHYAGPQHLPVIGANGVPVDEPAVQVARAEHVAAHVDAKVRNGDAAVLAHHVAGPVAYAAHHVAGHVAHPVAYAAGHVYAGAQHLPVIGANGVPVDEPAVQVARAEHIAAHVDAKVRNGDAAVLAHHVAGPVAYAAHHLAGHVAHPLAYSAGHVYAGHVFAGAQHLPVIGANGVPVDEPAVQVARAEHVAHHVEAKVRNGDAAVFAHHVAAPVAYAAHHVAHVAGAVVPADTPEVAAAKVAHYAAHVEAKVRNGDLHHHVVHAY